MLMGTHDCGIDHQPFQVGLACQNSQHFIEHAHLDPAVIAPLDRAIVAQILGQIAPATARAGHPEKRVQKFAVIRARPTLTLGTAGHEYLDPFPLVVAKHIAIHRQSPKISVESDLLPFGNPHSLNRHYALAGC
jgi:hypothetical protein